MRSNPYNAFIPQLIASRLLENLPLIRLSPRRVLSLGVECDYVNKFLQKKYPASHLSTLSLNSIEEYPDSLPFAAESFDLVVANLLLPRDRWQILCQEIYRVLSTQGLWLFSCWGADLCSEAHAIWEALEISPYTDPLWDMPSITDALFNLGFKDTVIDRENITITYANFRQWYRDLKGLGWGNLLTDRVKLLKNSQNLSKFLGEYEKYREKESQRLPATFEVAYGHAWRFNAGLNQEALIPISAIRRKRKTTEHYLMAQFP